MIVIKRQISFSTRTLTTTTFPQSLCLLKKLQIAPASLNMSPPTETKQYQESIQYFHNHALYIIELLSKDLFLLV